MQFLVNITLRGASYTVRSKIRNVVNLAATKHYNAHYHNIPKGHSINLPPNYAADHFCISLGRTLFHYGGEWGSSGKSKSRHRIHDHINPEKLNSVKRGFEQIDVPNENNNQATEVASNLELQESLNVCIDVASPHDRLRKRHKIVFNKDHVSGLFG